jgi:hypothetical protein
MNQSIKKWTKQVFYWYVEAEESPETAPVALWTNGGPGCSGLTGFMTEQGPFHVNEAGDLEKNPYAWSKVANMLFVEQPVGVGFSYSDDPASDYSPGDWDAARDNYAAILSFREKHPEVSGNDFYITAESYGGHYMPTLAKYIVDQQQQPNNTDASKIPFKGFAVGNPFTSKATNGYGEFATLYGHQLVSKPRWESWQKNCGPHYASAKEAELKSSIDGYGHDPIVVKPYRCIMDEEAMLGSIELNLNPYALDFPTCPHVSGNGKGGKKQQQQQRQQMTTTTTEAGSVRGGGRFGGAQRLALLRAKYADEPSLLKIIEEGLARAQRRHSSRGHGHGTGSAAAAAAASASESEKEAHSVGLEYEPCTDDYATAYLNRLDVQTAIHVNGGAAKSNATAVAWSECSRSLRYNMVSQLIQWSDEGSVRLMRC